MITEKQLIGDKMRNCLITKRGRIIHSTPGSTHEQTCRNRLAISLDEFFETGGVRIKTNGDEIAIEYYSKPTLKQQGIIRKELQANDYYVVILAFRSIRKFRPIRNFDIEQFKG